MNAAQTLMMPFWWASAHPLRIDLGQRNRPTPPRKKWLRSHAA